MKTLRRLLPALLLAAFAVPAVHAQAASGSSPTPCTGTTWVAPPNGGVSGTGCYNWQNGMMIAIPDAASASISGKRPGAPMANSIWAGDYGTTTVGAQSWAGSLANNNSAPYASAYGFQSYATAQQSTALGAATLAGGYGSLAAGYDAWSQGTSSIALLGTASNDYTIAIGPSSNASGLNALTLGYSSTAAASNSMAFGYQANVTAGATGSIAFSPLNGPTVLNPTQGQVTRAGVFDVGGRQISSVANGTQPLDAVNVQQLDAAIAGIPAGGSAPAWLASTEPTMAASAQGQSGAAIGQGSQAGNANTAFNTAIGPGAQAGTTGSAQAGTGGQATAVGAGAQATNIATEAFGYQSQAIAPFSTAIGNYSLADQANTVSFGNATTGTTRRLVNIADGIGVTDAMTVGQGQQLANVFGSGASFSGGVMTAPSYILTSPYAAGTYNNVGSALLALDNGQNALWGAINNLPTGGGGSPGPVGPTGPTGPAGQNGSNATVTAGTNIEVTQNAAGQDVVSTNPNMSLTSVTTTDGKGNTTVTSGNGVNITSASGGNVSLTGNGLNNGGNVISGVGAGQVSATSTDAVNGSQLYQVQQQSQDWAKSYTDQKFSQATHQANAAGATASAIGMLALGAQGIEQHDRLVMSTAVYNGSGAIGFGYNHVSESGRVSIAVGGAFGQHGGAIGASLGIGLGN